MTQVSAEDLGTDSAVMSMNLPIYASITQLDDFQLTNVRINLLMSIGKSMLIFLILS